MSEEDRDEREFRLLLPLTGQATHVVELYGRAATFEAALGDRVRNDLVAASALSGPIMTVSLGELADILSSLDAGTVLSIDLL